MRGAREIALRALLRVDVDKGYSNLVLDRALSEDLPDPRDRALAAAIFYGVLERRITLDYVIGRFSSLALEKISPVALEILRIGAYQILYMDKIPVSAAVSESVDLAKTCGAKRASGFVNGVLRSLIRSGGRVPAPAPGESPLERLSVESSCPAWIVSLWIRAYGGETAGKLLKALPGRPDLFARVNNTKVSEEKLIERLRAEGIEAGPAGWPDHALRIGKAAEIGRGACFREGLFHIQDLSSQILCALLDPRPGETVADLCSAPGGKAFTIAERMENRGMVLAFDKSPQKAGLIRGGAKRLGLSCVRAGVRDALSDGGPGEADRVLCDVPCSVLGVLRRKPEIRYKSPFAIDSLPDLQYRILCKSSGLVKKGGALFYSTCTLNPAENGEVAGRFQREHPDFSPLPLPLPEGFPHGAEEPENQLTLMPHLHGTDGFFVAAFRKR